MKRKFHVPFWEEGEGAISPSYSADYSGLGYTIVNGHTIFGLQVASKVFGIICDVELGKPFALHKLVETLQRVTMEQRA